MRMRPIPSTYGRYLAAEDGTIWHVNNGRAPTPCKPRAFGSESDRSRRGTYLAVTTSVNGTCVLRSVHRLVAEAWCPDWHWLLEVHHKNFDEADNRPENLECLTWAEHRLRHGCAVQAVDVANARTIFEEHMGDPMPDLYTAERRLRKKMSARRYAVGALRDRKRAENTLYALADRAETVRRRMEAAGL